MKKINFNVFLRRLNTFLGSNTCFYIVLAFLCITSLWVALTSLYPMAFDEDFHVGLIKIYAEIWNPFSVVQTPESDVFGSITTDPSYLFHYLMSFPYRALMLVIQHETATIIILRIFNIALFAVAMVVYRKVLLRAKIPSAIANSVFAVFVLLPVVPLLAGQINYDNLLILIVAVVFLLVIRIREQLIVSKTLSTHDVLSLIALLLFASVVKYAFLPIALGVVLYLAWSLFQVRADRKKWFTKCVQDIEQLSLPLKLACILVFSVGILLFAQRYVVNVIRYHDPVPDCAAVLNEERCMAYGPWGRDYTYAQNKSGIIEKNAVAYTVQDWSWGMWHRLFFTLGGPTNGYATRKQLPIPSITAIVILAFGVILAVYFHRSIFRQYPLCILFLVVSIMYVGALWFQQYGLYTYTGRAVAINGRYVIPLLPALGAIIGVAYMQFFRAIKQTRFAGLFACFIIILLLQGGGPITYIVRGESNWYWSNNSIQHMNYQLKRILQPVIIGD